MKKFAFSLATLLKVRGAKEKQAQVQLLTLGLQLEQQQELFQRYRALQQRYVHILRHKLQANLIDSADYQRHLGYSQKLAALMAALQHMMKETQKSIQRQQERMLRLTSQRKILENLQQRRQDVWDGVVAAKEKEQLDELAILRHFYEKQL